jgi:formylmethanofuran dehydrogenase subunit C
MPLRFANPPSERIPIDMAGVTPAALAALSLGDARRTKVMHGNRPCELGELLTIDGDGRDLAWQLEGDFGAVHGIGAGMAAGEIVADGSIGRHAGAEMSGGRIEVSGDAGDWLGAEMRGGTIRVRGDAGDFVGSAYAGSPRGMSGGEILIDGKAGCEIGFRMRRGLIAVAGQVGEFVGLRMLAGSILVFGACGPRPGASLRRGTIGLFGAEPPTLLPTFRLACTGRLPMLGLVERRLRNESFAPDRLSALSQPVALHHGDFLELGRGEILVLGS